MNYHATTIGGLRRENKSTDGLFIVHIDSARGITARDINGKSDPFVIVRFINYDGTIDETETFETPMQPNTLFPVWGYTKEWPKIKPNWKKIQFEIRDKDPFRTQFVGIYEHDIESIAHKDNAYDIYQLKPRRNSKKPDRVSGTIKLGFEYNNDLLKSEESEIKRKKIDKQRQAIQEVRRQLEEEHKEKVTEEMEKRMVDLHLVTDITSITKGLLTPREATEIFNKLVLTKDFVSALTPEHFQNKTDPILTAVMTGIDTNICSKLQHAKLLNPFISWILDLEDAMIRNFMLSFSKCDLAPLLNDERFSDSQDALLTLLMAYVTIPICESLKKCNKMIKAFDWAQGGTRKSLLQSIRWNLHGDAVAYEKNSVHYDLAKYYIKEFTTEENREAAFRVYMSGRAGHSVATLEDVAACGALSSASSSSIRGLLWADCIGICIHSQDNTDRLMQIAFDTLSITADIYHTVGRDAIDPNELEQYRSYYTNHATSNTSLVNRIAGMTNEKLHKIKVLCTTTT